MKLNSELMEFARRVRSIILASYIERPKTTFIRIKSSSLVYEVILLLDIWETAPGIEMRWYYTRETSGDRWVTEYISSGRQRLLGSRTATSTLWCVARNLRFRSKASPGA